MPLRAPAAPSRPVGVPALALAPALAVRARLSPSVPDPETASPAWETGAPVIPNVTPKIQRLFAVAASLAVLGVAAAVISSSGPQGSVAATTGGTGAHGATPSNGAGPTSSNPPVYVPPEDDTGAQDEGEWHMTEATTYDNDTTYDQDTSYDDHRVYDNDTTVDDHSDHSVSTDDHSTHDDHSDNSVSGHHQDDNVNENSNQNQQTGGIQDSSPCQQQTGAPLSVNAGTTEEGLAGVAVGVWAPVTVVVCDIYVLSGNNVNVGDVVDVIGNSIIGDILADQA